MYNLCIDQGTTSTKLIIFDKNNQKILTEQLEHKQITTKNNYLEHDPIEIINNIKLLLNNILKEYSIKFPNEELKNVGITNQRETLIVWNKTTKKPLYNAIVWKDSRNIELVNNYIKKYGKKYFKKINGLYINTYFTVFKFLWLIENVEEIKKEYENDNLLIGTMDSWICFNLLEGNPHITDYSNASRTFLLNLNNLTYDEEILKNFGIKKNVLPKIVDSNKFHGNIIDKNYLQVNSILGDQQSSCLGLGILDENYIKCTFGTGCFILKNTGEELKYIDGLLTTVLWKNVNEKPIYGLEGSIEIGGNIINYFKNKLNLFKDFEVIEKKLEDSDYHNNKIISNLSMNEFYSPFWIKNNNSMILGIDFNSEPHCIYQSILENIAHRIYDCYKLFNKKELNFILDGGVSKSNYLLSYLKLLTNSKNIYRSVEQEGTSLGVNYGSNYINHNDKKKFYENIIKNQKTKEIKVLDKLTYNQVQEKYNQFSNLIGFSK